MLLVKSLIQVNAQLCLVCKTCPSVFYHFQAVFLPVTVYKPLLTYNCVCITQCASLCNLCFPTYIFTIVSIASWSNYIYNRDVKVALLFQKNDLPDLEMHDLKVNLWRWCCCLIYCFFELLCESFLIVHNKCILDHFNLFLDQHCFKFACC